MAIRELTRARRRDIHTLVTTMCANYCGQYKSCLLSDGECSMLDKADTGGDICKYFKDAILPLNPILEAALTGKVLSQVKPCAICGKKFIPVGRQVYCSDLCENQGNRIKSRERMQKKRSNVTI